MSSGERERLIVSLKLEPIHLERMATYEALVRRWSNVKNLVSASALKELWVRHLLDSAQVQRSSPSAKIWADLGSGGGFPGIVTAILLADDSTAHVHLVESDGRKSAFLRAVSRETGLRTTVHHARIEDVARNLIGVEAVSARALAEMDKLVEWSFPLLEKGAHGVFPKGKGYREELTNLTRDSRFILDIRPSISQSDGAIVLVKKREPSDGDVS
jgi:16S rRNA (guanine527-N7)-methyltransferase